MEDLKEHIGTILVIVAAMWGLVLVFGGVIWKQVRDDLNKFPSWLADMDRCGGVVTHAELLEEGPLMTSKTHEIICSRVVSQIAAQITISERHQRDMLDLIEREFKAVAEGQKSMIDRLSTFQNTVLQKLTEK